MNNLILDDDVLSYVRSQILIIYVGMDFNVNNMASVLSLYSGGVLYAFKEYVGYEDTPDLIEAIESDFPDNKIICFPDSSGKNRSTTNAKTSDIALLRKAKFTVRARNKNPFVKDRVAAVNNAFNHKKLFVDTDRCPELTEALEQQIWKPNGQPDKESGLDHIVDALGYMVSYLMPVRDIKLKTVVTVG
jgi:hypothetical protein